jgi:hypothetical protein
MDIGVNDFSASSPLGVVTIWWMHHFGVRVFEFEDTWMALHFVFLNARNGHCM